MFSAIISFLVLMAIALLVVDVPLFLWWRDRERNRERTRVLPARDRAAAVVRRALDAYRAAELEDPHLPRQDLWVCALVAASGESAAEATARVAKAAQRSDSQATLQMLLAVVAAGQERELALEVGPEQLMKNIAAAEQTVERLVSREM